MRRPIWYRTVCTTDIEPIYRYQHIKA